MATVGAVYCRNPALLDYEASMLVIGLVDGGFIKTLSKAKIIYYKTRLNRKCFLSYST